MTRKFLMTVFLAFLGLASAAAQTAEPVPAEVEALAVIVAHYATLPQSRAELHKLAPQLYPEPGDLAKLLPDAEVLLRASVMIETKPNTCRLIYRPDEWQELLRSKGVNLPEGAPETKVQLCLMNSSEPAISMFSLGKGSLLVRFGQSFFKPLLENPSSRSRDLLAEWKGRLEADSPAWTELSYRSIPLAGLLAKLNNLLSADENEIACLNGADTSEYCARFLLKFELASAEAMANVSRSLPIPYENREGKLEMGHFLPDTLRMFLDYKKDGVKYYVLDKLTRKYPALSEHFEKLL